MNYLYHATFRSKLSSIRKNGLMVPGEKAKLSYEGQVYQRGIYLGKDIDFCGSMLECADNVSESVYESGIVILAIPVVYLNKGMFERDENLLGEANEMSMVYKRNIPVEYIRIVKNPNGKCEYKRLLEVSRVTKEYLY